jgi:dATP pyrophosphohydrolase
MSIVPRYKNPESVLVLIIGPSRQILLLQRRDDPTFWQSVTGSLGPGESIAQAAERELWEETGLQVGQDGHLQDCHCQWWFDIYPQWIARYAPGITQNLEHVFLFTLNKAKAICLSPTEHLDYAWVDKATALRWLSSNSNREALHRFMEK